MSKLSHRRLRAPQADGTALIDPPLAAVPALLSGNRALADTWDARSGLPFSKWREEARRQLDAEHRPLILTGHQPTLFHPGVWLKNFVLDRIAQEVGGLAVNLAIDSDTLDSAGISVPTGDLESPRLAEVSFDAHAAEIPLEEHRVLDHATFRSFAERVRNAYDPLRGSHALGRGPLLIDYLWDHARQIVSSEMEGPMPGQPDDRPQAWTRLLLGDCLAKARHRLERDVGLTTQPLWLRSVCTNWPFFFFVEQLLRRWPDLHPIYNAALEDYRIVNHIRSRHHPVPNLARDGEWLEVPFWIWSSEQPVRRRAFVRPRGETWDITDRSGTILRANEGRPNQEGEPLAWTTAYMRADIKIRPRALITTMYARLVLSDLFIHGIGGARYDELTDEIIRRFFGIEPPGYLTATGTFRLPIERPQVTAEDLRNVARRIRDVRYRPESFLGDPLLAREPAIAQHLQSLADEKRHYLASHPVRRGSREEFSGLDRINRAMHDLLRPVEEHLRREQARLTEDARRARLLESREFSFVLFPEEFLVPRLLELSKVPA